MPTISEIKAHVCTHYGIERRFMDSGRTNRKYSRPRQMAMYLSHRTTKRSMSHIGREFGRTFWTVRHAVAIIESDYERMEEAATIAQALTGGNSLVERVRAQIEACRSVGAFIQALGPIPQPCQCSTCEGRRNYRNLSV